MKIILVIIIFLFAAFISTIIGKSTGHTTGGGPIGTIIMVGAVAAIIAIWKYKPEDKDKNDDNNVDNQKLDKQP